METIGSTCHPYLAINGRKWEGLVPSKSQPWSSKLNETWQVQNGGSNNIKNGADRELCYERRCAQIRIVVGPGSLLTLS